MEKIPKEEGYLVEFKGFLGGLSPKELAITMCSFANTDGGDIFIGVTDTRQIMGVKLAPNILDGIQNAAREGCVPPVSISLNQIKINTSRIVIRVSVEKSRHLHSTAAGRTYVRVGTQDKKTLGDELLRLAETKSQTSYEEHLLDFGIEVIDVEALNQYYEARKIYHLSKNI
ncbi:ATP-binding protein [bacterium]|nr:ATP-binding protein [bacterium]